MKKNGIVDENHVLELLPAYALGSLEAEEALEVEEHLLRCWECRQESNQYQVIAEQLSLAVPPVAPPPAVRERLVQRLQAWQAPQAAPQPGRPRLARLLPVGGLASLAFLIVLGIFGLLLWQRINRLEVATSPGGMRAVPLSGTEEGPDATGFVLVSIDGRSGALVVDGLPPLDASHEYQLWLVQDEQRISGAIFSTDEQNYGGTRIRAPGSLLEYQAAVVTIEPAGGSETPTGAAVLQGSLFKP